MALEKQKVIQSNKTAQERKLMNERTMQERKKACDELEQLLNSNKTAQERELMNERTMQERKKACDELEQLLNSNKTPEEREIERREIEKTAEEREIERREKKNARSRARYAEMKKASNKPGKALEERFEIMKEKRRASERDRRAKMRESAEEWEAYKEKEKACLTGIGPSTKAEDGINALTALEWHKKRMEMRKLFGRALYARKKKAREEQQRILNSNKTPDEREMERVEKEKTAEEREIERREKKNARSRARYAEMKKASNKPGKTLEERFEIMKEKRRVSERDRRAKRRESVEEWEAYKERERARGRARYAEKKKACLTGPSKAEDGINTLTPFEWYKKRMEKKNFFQRALYAKKKKAREEQQRILNSNKTPEEREIERREKEKNAQEREMVRREKNKARLKKAREEQRMLEQNKTPEERETEWVEKFRARHRAIKRKALEEEREVLMSNEIVDERGALDRACHANKEAPEIVYDTLVEDEIKDLVSHRIERVDDTLEEGSGDLRAKSINEARQTVAPVTQVRADHDYAQKSALKERTKIKYLRRKEISFVPSYLLRDFKLSLHRSNSLRNEQIDRNSIKIRKELESGQKARFESDSRNVLINCASRAVLKSEKIPLEGDGSKNEVGNEKEIAVWGSGKKKFAEKKETECREKAIRALQELKILKPPKSPEERDIERRKKIKARDRARYAKKKEARKIKKEVRCLINDLVERVDNTLEEDPLEDESSRNKVRSAQRKEACKEQQRLKPRKTPDEERGIERRKRVKARYRERKRKALEEQRKVLKSNKIVDVKLEKRKALDRACCAEIKEAREIVSGTPVEDEINDLVSDLIERVDTLDGPGDLNERRVNSFRPSSPKFPIGFNDDLGRLRIERVKSACKTASPVTQRLADHCFALKSNPKMINEIVYLKKTAVAVVPSDRIKEFRLSLYRSNSFRNEQFERNSIKIMKEQKICQKPIIASNSQNVLISGASCAESENNPLEGDSSENKVAAKNKKEIVVCNERTFVIVAEKLEKRRALDRARHAKKEAPKTMSSTLIEDEIKDLVSDLIERVDDTLEEGSGDLHEKKDLVSDLIERVDDTLEEGSGDLHEKRMREASETAAPATQTLADHDNAPKSDSKMINEVAHLRRSAVTVVAPGSIKEFKSSLLCSKPLQDELLERNRMGILKAIERFLEQKAQTENTSQNLLTSCASRAEQKVAVGNAIVIPNSNKIEITNSNKIEIPNSSKIEIPNSNKIEITNSNKTEISVTNKTGQPVYQNWFINRNEIAARNKREIDRVLLEYQQSVEKRLLELKEKKRAMDRASYARKKKAHEEKLNLSKTPEERNKEKTAEEREMERREKRRANERANYARRKKAFEEQHSSNAAVCIGKKCAFSSRYARNKEKKRASDRAYYYMKKARAAQQILKHPNNEAGCNDDEAAASNKLDEKKEIKRREKEEIKRRAKEEIKKREKEEKEIKRRAKEELKRREKEEKEIKRRSKEELKRRETEENKIKIREYEEIIRREKEEGTLKRREKEEGTLKRRERKKAYERARYARIQTREILPRKTPEEMEIEKKEKARACYANNNKEARQGCVNSINEVGSYLKPQYLLIYCADPAEQNCATGPLESEKPLQPSLQPVSLQMEVEVEPRPIEPLLTYVKKEIEPLMPCVDEEHSQPMEIKTEPEELQEESLLSYVNKDFMHSMPCVKDGQPGTEPELQRIEESLLNFVDKEFVPVTSCIEECDYSDSLTSTSSSRKSFAGRKNRTKL